jgi:serine/threonine protein kinase
MTAPAVSSGCSSAALLLQLADFGFSRKLNYTEMLQTNSYGSVTHMPPELLGEGLLSKAADVYSLGVLLWQMYNGSRPWAGAQPGRAGGLCAAQRMHAWHRFGSSHCSAHACMQHMPTVMPLLVLQPPGHTACSCTDILLLC